MLEKTLNGIMPGDTPVAWPLRAAFFSDPASLPHCLPAAAELPLRAVLDRYAAVPW